MSPRRVGPAFLFFLVGTFISSLAMSICAQEPPRSDAQGEKAQLELRKAVKTRPYQGRLVEGEERVISRGDSLWRILIQEKGLSQKRFSGYLVVIGALNPDIEKLDILQVGETLFIPISPDEILGIRVPTAKSAAREETKGQAKVYRVQRGDTLYKIIRDQLGLVELREIDAAFSRVKVLNPQKRDWDLLLVGESIRLPRSEEKQPAPTPEVEKPAPPQVVVDLDYPQKIPVAENLALLEKVVAILGNEIQREGNEVLSLREGTIRIERKAYPVIQNPKLAQRVILDPEGKMPPSLQSRLRDQQLASSVVSLKTGASLQEAVAALLSNLGFQLLPSNRPAVLRDQGVGVEVKGHWIALGPEETGRDQQMFIVALVDPSGQTPDYLKDYLRLRGMDLKEILVPSTTADAVSRTSRSHNEAREIELQNWPQGKESMVDAFLHTLDVSFSANANLSIPLRVGIRLETRADRLLDFKGNAAAVFFNPVSDEIKTALPQILNMKAIELDLNSLSSREVISRLLAALGEQATYREHRLPAVEGAAKDKLLLAIAGFFLPQRSLLLTDREIPRDLQRFFVEKGIRVVYFQ